MFANFILLVGCLENKLIHLQEKLLTNLIEAMLLFLLKLQVNEWRYRSKVLLIYSACWPTLVFAVIYLRFRTANSAFYRVFGEKKLKFSHKRFLRFLIAKSILRMCLVYGIVRGEVNAPKQYCNSFLIGVFHFCTIFDHEMAKTADIIIR
jgi:hypothetical protein